ncbi:MAG: Rpn family recombination-promoting nuclease/putative transposase [Campylobacterota bacterium]|nr:Rpn family recombination-promoting nuclease/putative transposase [Campylobacterota bacterium]
MRFLDVKTDYAFKKVFGSDTSKGILKSFLNALVYDNKSVKIKELEIVDPYNIPMIKGVKDTFVDVKAILDDNTKVIIEMQVLNHTGFEKRVLYNAAKNYSIQLNKSEDYHLLNPVIALSIVDFDMFEDSSSVVTNFKLIEKEQLLHYNDDIELIFVELPKFKKELEELENIKDQWIYFIKNAGSLEYIPENLNNNIKQALTSVNEANLTKDEIESQHKRKEFISIQKLALMKAKDDGMAQGLEQGIEKGIEQGIEQRNIQIAKNLLDILDDETISLKTGLKVETIKQLRK